eukprot:TRINITY_DN4861_c0_g1_i1.p1 TRINITY_DN4861_c0_g1~~TRINITY_DN4861_c0_g1_i1.p1  ORF type:complete len:340 (+),score=45.57 TRINITY_DN4861_c0_g1_i1:43-1020(+)
MASKKHVIRVFFIDNSFTAFAVYPSDSVKILFDLLVEKIQLKHYHHFALFERGSASERFLGLEEKPVELAEKWEDPQQCFVFKKKLFLNDYQKEKKELEDMIAQDLIYKQALCDVISSTLLCSTEQAIKLSSLQMKIIYGDYNSCIHMSGFLTASDSLKNFVPKHLYPLRKANEWEAYILKQHQYANVSLENAKLEYINIVRSIDNYGTTFFPPCKSLIRTSNFPSKIIIGINYYGITLFRAKNREFLVKFQFAEVCSWTSSQSMFGFEVGFPYSQTKMVFETRHGVAIAVTIQNYVEIIIQTMKCESDEEDSERCDLTSVSSDY